MAIYSRDGLKHLLNGVTRDTGIPSLVWSGGIYEIDAMSYAYKHYYAHNKEADERIYVLEMRSIVSGYVIDNELAYGLEEAVDKVIKLSRRKD